jgi:hypothetical protein
MSPDLIYSVSASVPDPTPLLIPELVQAGREAGLILHVARNLVWEPPDFTLVEAGELKDVDYVWGCRPNDSQADLYRHAVEKRQLHQLYAWGPGSCDPTTLGAAEIYVNALPYKDKPPPGSPDDLIARSADGALVRQAKVEYVIDPHCQDNEFCLDLARLLRRLRGGMIVWQIRARLYWETTAASQPNMLELA